MQVAQASKEAPDPPAQNGTAVSAAVRQQLEQRRFNADNSSIPEYVEGDTANWRAA